MTNLSKRALVAKPSSTLAVAAMAKKMKEEGIDIISFSAGEPDFDTPEYIKAAAVKALEDGFTKYTAAAGTDEIRKAIAKKLKDENDLNFDFKQIVVSNGAKHALFNTFMAILDEGDEVIIPAPYWISYSQMVELAGGTPIIVYSKKENKFKITKEELESALTKKTKAIIVNSPCNPTGSVYEKEELEMIADFAVKNDLYVISDEIYEKLIFNENIKHVSIASLNDEIFKRTIVINGFSKSYSMTGWRIGYTASSLEIANAISSMQSHCTSNVNSITLKAGYAALTNPQTSIEEMAKEFHKRRDYIYDRVSAIPHISAIKPEGAFYIFVDVSEFCGKTYNGVFVEDSAVLSEIILEKCKVAVVSGNDFGYDKFIRISYSTSMEAIKIGMDRLEEFIKNFF